MFLIMLVVLLTMLVVLLTMLVVLSVPRLSSLSVGRKRKAEGKNEAYYDELSDDVEVCEDVEMCEDMVEEVQDGSVAWPCCLWCWCSLARLVALDQAGVDGVGMLKCAKMWMKIDDHGR